MHECIFVPSVAGRRRHQLVPATTGRRRSSCRWARRQCCWRILQSLSMPRRAGRAPLRPPVCSHLLPPPRQVLRASFLFPRVDRAEITFTRRYMHMQLLETISIVDVSRVCPAWCLFCPCLVRRWPPVSHLPATLCSVVWLATAQSGRVWQTPPWACLTADAAGTGGDRGSSGRNARSAGTAVFTGRCSARAKGYEARSRAPAGVAAGNRLLWAGAGARGRLCPGAGLQWSQRQTMIA